MTTTQQSANDDDNDVDDHDDDDNEVDDHDVDHQADDDFLLRRLLLLRLPPELLPVLFLSLQAVQKQ